MAKASLKVSPADKQARIQADATGAPSRRRLEVLIAGAAAVILAIFVWQLSRNATMPREAPEANLVLHVQASMPFQILIPAYLPGVFAREATAINANQVGPGGEPMVQLTYRTANGQSLFVREWIPVNPDMEILAGSRPVETKWGKAWLLTQGRSLVAIWVDVGPLRVSIYTTNLDAVNREAMVQIANTLGPASNLQTFTFVVDQQPIKEVAPQVVAAKINQEGIQEIVLVVTPGGYHPLRFSVRKDVPVRLTFRMLGQVGCGNVLIFPADPQNPSALTLNSEQDKQVLEYTPRLTGSYEFHCAHNMYRGIVTVLE